MAFGVGSYLTIWGAVNKGSYYEVDTSSSKKNRQTGNYETDFSSKFVRFCGEAAKKNPQAGQKIKITNCAVQNCYEKNGARQYLKNPMYIVFDYELQDTNGNRSATPNNNYNPYSTAAPVASPISEGFEELTLDDGDDLPF